MVMLKKSAQAGQALSELLVSLAVIAPLFLLIPVVANYLDIQTATHEAGRYVTWERTVYEDLSQTPDSIGALVKSRFIDNEDSGFSGGDVERQLRWVDHGKSRFNTLVDYDSEVAVTPLSVIEVNLNDPVAASGLSVLEGVSPDALGVSEISVPLTSDSSLFKLYSRSDNYLVGEGEQMSEPNDPVSGQSRFHTKAVGALLADGGVVPLNEAQYTAMTESFVKTDGNRLMRWQPLASGLIYTRVGDILNDGNKDAVSQTQSTTLPSRYME